MYNPNLNSYACMYSYVQFPALQSHNFSDPNGINSCVGPYHVDQRFQDGRYHPASGIYFNEDFSQTFAGQTAYFSGAPQNVSSNLFTGMAHNWPYPSQTSFQTQIQTADRTNNGKFKLPPAPLLGFSCNAQTHNSPSAVIQGAWNFEAAASGEQMQIKENGDKIHSTADVAENCQHPRNVINEGHKNVAVVTEPQGQRSNKSDQNQWRYPDQHGGYANPLPPLQQFHIDPITKRPYLLDTPSVRPQMYEDISDDSEEDFKPLPETNNGSNHIISTSAFPEDSRQVGSKSYMKDAVYIPASTENNQQKDCATSSSNELKFFLDKLDSAQRQSEANELFTSDLVTKASKKCYCMPIPEPDASTTIKTEVMSPKEELMTFDEDQPYEEEVTSYEEVKQTLPESVQISSLPFVGSRTSARKQKNPRRSVPLKDPTFKGVVFTVQTRLLDKTPSLVMAPCRSSGRVGRRIRSLARRRSCSSTDTTSESDNESNNPVSPPRLGKQCASCNTRKTPLWRDAEDGTPLCNACGIRYKKYRIRCTRCWNIPKKDSKTYPRCSSCGSPLRYALIKKMIVN